jgi:hypothetical protein
MPPRCLLSQAARRPVTVPAALPPAGRLPTLPSAPLRGLRRPASGAHHPNKPDGSGASPADFCNHHGSRARLRDGSESPHALPEVSLLRGAHAGSRTPRGARPARSIEPRGRRQPCGMPAPPLRSLARGACPRDRITRTPPVTSPCPRRPEKPGADSRTNPTNPPAVGARAPPAQGPLPPPIREEGQVPRTRGAFHSNSFPKEAPGSPQVVSNLWIPRNGAFFIVAIPCALTCTRFRDDSTLDGHRPKPHRMDAAPRSISTIVPSAAR